MTARCIRLFGLGNTDCSHRDTKLCRRIDRILSLVQHLFAVMEQVATDGQIVEFPGQQFEPDQRIFPGVGPISVGYDPNAKAHIISHLDPAHEQSIIQEWLTAFKINRLDPCGLSLVQNDFDLLQCERACLPGTAPNKTMVTLESALVRQ